MKKIKLKEYKDHRGSLVENTLPKILNDSEHFFISKSKVGVIRGNHYHRRKSEWFYVIQGKCKLCIQDIATAKKEEIVINDKQNIMINIGPNKAHAFKNIGNKELILLALVNEVHNQMDSDTFKYKVI